MAKVNIDGKEYETDTLSDAARENLAKLRMSDQRIQQLQQDLMMIQAGRQVFATALKENLPKDA